MTVLIQAQHATPPDCYPTVPTEQPPAPEVEWPKLAAVYSYFIRFAGTCQEGATVELFIASKWETVSSIGTNWCYSLKDLASGDHDLQVRQTVNGVVSNPRPVPRFFVRPPSQVPLPEVNEPPPNSFVPTGSAVQFKGTCEPNAQVAIFDLNENLLGRAVVIGTSWSFEHTWNQSEVVYVKIRQVVGDEVSAVVGRWIGVGLTENRIEVRITTPPFDIDPVPVGSYLDFAGTCTKCSGTADYVFVIDEGMGVWQYGSIVGDRWFVRVGPFKKSGNYFTEALIRDGSDGNIYSLFTNAWRKFTVYEGTPLTPPTIRIPVSGSTHPIGSVAVDGLCEEGATVELFNGAGTKLNDALVVGNKWYSSLTLGPGSYSIRARQKKNDLVSEPSELVEFSVQ